MPFSNDGLHSPAVVSRAMAQLSCVWVKNKTHNKKSDETRLRNHVPLYQLNLGKSYRKQEKGIIIFSDLL
jgi:hypothetical protein